MCSLRIFLKFLWELFTDISMGVFLCFLWTKMCFYFLKKCFFTMPCFFLALFVCFFFLEKLLYEDWIILYLGVVDLQCGFQRFTLFLGTILSGGRSATSLSWAEKIMHLKIPVYVLEMSQTIFASDWLATLVRLQPHSVRSLVSYLVVSLCFSLRFGKVQKYWTYGGRTQTLSPDLFLAEWSTDWDVCLFVCFFASSYFLA